LTAAPCSSPQTAALKLETAPSEAIHRVRLYGSALPDLVQHYFAANIASVRQRTQRHADALECKHMLA
jgi:hypothetical protein